MSTSDNPSETQETRPQVAAVLYEGEQLVINRGELHGIRVGQRFVVYGLGDEMLDPATGKSLGRLEIVKGSGKAIHVQPSMTTIETDRKRPGKSVTRRVRPQTTYLFSSMMEPEAITETEPDILIPFAGAEVGDFARPV